jgi:hypothetical protein
LVATQRINGKQAKPVTSHPLFPAVVALWFGALFGVGSLVPRTALIEDLVIAARIDLLVSAAAPPLGLTARLLLALGLAAFGALLGGWIGRKLAEVKPEKRQRRRDARMVNAEAERHVAPGGSVAANPSPAASEEANPAGRRRTLALDEEERHFEINEMAPLPGGLPQIFAVADTGIAPIDAPDHVPNHAVTSPEPLELAQFVSPTVPEPDAPVATSERQIFRPVPVAPSEPPRQIFVPVEPQPETSAAPEPVAAPMPVIAAAAPVPAPDRLPPRVEAIAEPVAPEAAPVVPSVFAAPPPPPLFAREPVEARPAPPPPAPIDPEAPLTDLAQRLAEAMQRRRAARSPSTAEPRPADPLPYAFRPVAPADPAVGDDELVLPSLIPPRLDPQARAQVQAALQPAAPIEAPLAPMELPAALRPLVPEALGSDDPLPSMIEDLLPPRQLVIPPVVAVAAPAGDEAEEGEEASGGNDDRFSSLLSVAPKGEAPRNPFVRIEEPAAPVGTIEPVVIFPGQAAQGRPFDPPTLAIMTAPANAAVSPDQDETERALKLALASLQRMSGAA